MLAPDLLIQAKFAHERQGAAGGGEGNKSFPVALIPSAGFKQRRPGHPGCPPGARRPWRSGRRGQAARPAPLPPASGGASAEGRGCPPPATAPCRPDGRAEPRGAVGPASAGRGPSRGRGEGRRLHTQQEAVHVKDQVSDRPQRGRGGGSGHGEARAAGGPRGNGASALRRGGRSQGGAVPPRGAAWGGPERALVPGALSGGPSAVARGWPSGRGAEERLLVGRFVVLFLKQSPLLLAGLFSWRTFLFKSRLVLLTGETGELPAFWHVSVSSQNFCVPVWRFTRVVLLLDRNLSHK